MDGWVPVPFSLGGRGVIWGNIAIFLFLPRNSRSIIHQSSQFQLYGLNWSSHVMYSLASKVFTVSGGASWMGLATCCMLATAKAKAILHRRLPGRWFRSHSQGTTVHKPQHRSPDRKSWRFLFCLRNRLDQRHHLELRHAGRRCQCGWRGASCRREEESRDFEWDRWNV